MCENLMSSNGVIAIPTAGHPHPDALHSIFAEAARCGAPICYSQYSPRDVNRNRIIRQFLNDSRQHDWLVMVDDDQIVPEGAIENLLSVERDIVIGPTPILVGDRVVVNVAMRSDNPNARYRWPSLKR